MKFEPYDEKDVKVTSVSKLRKSNLNKNSSNRNISVTSKIKKINKKLPSTNFQHLFFVLFSILLILSFFYYKQSKQNKQFGLNHIENVDYKYFLQTKEDLSNLLDLSSKLEKCLNNNANLIKTLQNQTNHLFNLEKQINLLKENLNSCQNDKRLCINNLEVCKLKESNLLTEINRLKIANQNLKANISILMEKIKKLNNEILNFANDYCCIRKVLDDKKYKYFEVKNGKAICLMNKTNNSYNLNC